MAKTLNITSEKLASLLEATADLIRQEVGRNRELNKLARAIAIVEPLQAKGLLSKMAGRTISEQAQELAKMADKDFQVLEYMAQNSPQAYRGFGKESNPSSPEEGKGNLSKTARDIDRVVMGR